MVASSGETRVGRQADILIRGGTVVDGTGSSPVNADVAISGGVISAVGPPGSLAAESAIGAESAIDATGLVVAPGFVDIHSHADFTLLVDGRAHSSVLQGVTTVVTGNCGHGIAPVVQASRELVRTNVPCWRSEWTVAGSWESFGDYLAILRRGGVGVNVVPLVAHGALRLAAAGFEPRPLSRREIETLQEMVREAMDAGAAGISSGLEYAPGLAATTEELVALAEPAGEAGGLYATHCRNRTDQIVGAAEEAVAVAERTGCRLQLSHFVRRPTATDRSFASRAVEVVREADARGVRSRLDVFPFDHGPTPLATFVLPMWAREGAPAEVAARLESRQVRERLLAELPLRFLDALASGIAATMCVATDGAAGELVGLTIEEIAARWGLSPPATIVEILRRAGENFYEATVVERWADWLDLCDAIAAHDYLIMGDGATACLDGPLAHYAFCLADWGYAAEMLGRFVRLERLVPLEGAIAKMTSGPAAQIGLTDRGVIEAGRRADVVVFDPARIASLVRPRSLAVRPAGVEHVLVNGAVVVRSGQTTDALPGTVGLR